MASKRKGLRKMDAAISDGARHIERRLVPDPMMTDAEYFEQRRTRSGPHVGKVSAEINMIELIGGLARIRDRSEVQEAAAAKFRLLHERAQLGGARSIDYAAVRVDTSGAGDVVEFGEAARRDYADAVRHLGMIRSSLVERVVVYDMSLRDIAGQGGRSKAKAKKGLQEALDDLAVHFRLAPKPRS
jgi:hypothetical protein